MAKETIRPNNKRAPAKFSPGLGKLKIPIATKLILGYLLVIVFISGVFMVVGARLISRLILSEAQEKVRNDLNSAREIYQHELNHIDEIVRNTGNRFFLRDSLLSGNLDSAFDELERIKKTENLDMLAITDKYGYVLLRTCNPGFTGDNLGHDQIIHKVLFKKESVAATIIVSGEDLKKDTPDLAEKSNIELIDTPLARNREGTEVTDGMMLKAAAPIFDYENNLIGVIYGGVLLNQNYEIVDKIKQTVYEDVIYNGQDVGTATIFMDDIRISTNVRNEDGSRAIGTRVSEEVYNQVIMKGEPWIDRAYVVNNWYITAYEPITDLYGRIIGILYVGILEQKYLDTQKQTILAFLGISIVGVLVSMAASYFIAHSIHVPIQMIVSASKRVAGGDLNTKVFVQTNDELQYLAESFNSMSTALKKRDEQIKDFATKKIMEAERLALIGQLSANVAHELNNPLQGVVTFSHLLLEEHPCDDPFYIEAVEKIVGQANRCRDIIRGLLDFSRQRKPDKTICNLNTVLEYCVSLLEKQALFHNINIVKNLQIDLPMTVADPSQIERVFINLIVNAAEAMDGSGKLTLTTFFNAKDKTIEVDIKDTGSGIRKEDMDKIFDPFFTTKDVGHGTGLGLAISYGIVKSHKGNLLVNSVEKKGTTFTIVLPVVSSEEGNGNGNGNGHNT